VAVAPKALVTTTEVAGEEMRASVGTYPLTPYSWGVESIRNRKKTKNEDLHIYQPLAPGSTLGN